MRHHLIPLAATVCIICCSMSDCKRDLIQSTHEVCPISLSINGTHFSGDECSFLPWWDFKPHRLYLWEDQFGIDITRDIFTDDKENSVSLRISYRGKGYLEIGKKYEFNHNDKNTYISFILDDEYFTYASTDGWIILSECYCDKSTSRVYMSGEFEFNATELNNGDTMQVTDGKFENLRAYCSASNWQLVIYPEDNP